MLSRWVNVPAVAVRAVVVFASSAPDEIMPSKDTICEVQQQARASLGTMVGRATKDDDLFRMRLDGRELLWISKQAMKMQTRLMRSH